MLPIIENILESDLNAKKYVWGMILNQTFIAVWAKF